MGVEEAAGAVSRELPLALWERGLGVREAVHRALALIPIVLLVGALVLLARWEQRRPPGG
jgi:hypothetical protein